MKRVEKLLKTYDLWNFRNMYPKELSGGIRQRIALIRTLAVDPDVLTYVMSLNLLLVDMNVTNITLLKKFLN